jgi:hypothetical protein
MSKVLLTTVGALLATGLSTLYSLLLTHFFKTIRPSKAHVPNKFVPSVRNR